MMVYKVGKTRNAVKIRMQRVPENELPIAASDNDDDDSDDMDDMRMRKTSS